ncbi:hypothetical protein BDF21DRAFT_395971 [Thamnidium elegans]|nr:hypothetical protein BDF21DRAFT_395971 [Thamnidium elegans]
MVKLGIEKADQRVIEPNKLEKDDLQYQSYKKLYIGMAINPSLPNITSHLSAENIQLLPNQTATYIDTAPVTFPIIGEYVPFMFKMPISLARHREPVNSAPLVFFNSLFPTNTPGAPILPKMSVNYKRRMCKSCEMHTCPGKSNRKKCNSTVCLKCGKKEGRQGICDKERCNN